MSRLEELIQELCPDGVGYKKIKDIYKRLKGTPITATKMKEISAPDGEIRIFAGGKTVISAEEKDIPNANITRVPAVLVQSRGVIDVVYYERPFTFKNEMWAYTADEKVTVKFLYYVLKNSIQSFRDAASGMGSLPQISLPVTEEFLIPIPPLPVQSEIVKILDKFTEVTAQLQEQLALEVTARRKQYEYYRDKLLTFDVFAMGASDVVWRALGEIADIRTGRRPKIVLKEGFFEYINAGTSNSGYTTDFSFPEDTVTTPSRGQGGIGFIGYQKNPFWLGPLCYGIRAKESNIICNKFLYYFLCSNSKKILQKKNEGGTPALNLGDLQTVYIPIPSLSVQHRIVTILDRFDALCNDLASGLPAEIEARKKQYEYYRDKLLSFKERAP